MRPEVCMRCTGSVCARERARSVWANAGEAAGAKPAAGSSSWNGMENRDGGMQTPSSSVNMLG